jgi:hypothetical protein
VFPVVVEDRLPAGLLHLGRILVFSVKNRFDTGSIRGGGEG